MLASVAASPLTGQSPSSAQYDPSALRLQYSRAAQKWVEALPIGNGRLGAMVFGGVGANACSSTRTRSGRAGRATGTTRTRREVLPEVRPRSPRGRTYVEADPLARGMQGPYTQSYLPLGDLVLTFEHGEQPRDYRRSSTCSRRSRRASFASATTHYRARGHRVPSRPADRRAAHGRPAGDAHLRRHARQPASLRRAPGRRRAEAERTRAGARRPELLRQDDPVRYRDDGGMSFEIRLAAVPTAADADRRTGACTFAAPTP